MFIEQQLDICFITESWLKKNDKAKLAEFHEYHLDIINKSRSGKGGGVGFIYNPKRLKLFPNNVKKYSSFEVHEALVRGPSDLIRLCVIYRSTQHTTKAKYEATKQSKFFEEFSDYLDCLAAKSGIPVIAGDFNFHIERSEDSITRQFVALFEERGFQQHITEPTHISGGTLDILLTRCQLDDTKKEYNFENVHISDNIDVENCSVISETGTTSDHFLVTFQLTLEIEQDDTPNFFTKTIREFRKMDIDSFKEKLIPALLDLSDVKDVNCLVEEFNASLLNSVNEFAPEKQITISNKHSDWWNSTCDEARRERRRAERQYKKNKSNSELYQIYKEKQVDANIILNKQRDKFYTNKLALAFGNPKETYKIVNNLLDKEFGKQLQPNGIDSQVASNLQSFFHSKVAKIYESVAKSCAENNTKIQCSTPQENNILSSKTPHMSSKTPNMSKFRVMSTSEVASVIKSMGNKSCCLDPIPTYLLKDCLDELLPFITLIVNSSLQTGTFPDSLKTAIVKALLKKTNLDVDDLSNYRPVSNLSFISKIIEKCVHLQLTDYIEVNNLFPSLQSGYRKNHSCETAIIKIYNDLLIATDKQSHAILVLIDLSAAFDTINHTLLIKKLESVYNIGGNVTSWLKSYLQNRKFKVLINDTFSEESPLEIGVPQGSILGPLLFILYTEGLQELANKYNFSVHLYADDTQIYFQFHAKDPSIHITMLQNCFSEINTWMSLNYLKMNNSKTEVLELHSPYTSIVPLSTLDLEGCCIELSDSAKNLGFWFDKSLSLEVQVKHVAKIGYLNLRNISRIGSKLSMNLKIQLVHGCIHSILDYCNAAYYGLNKYQLKKLQSVQNASARFIYGLKGEDRFQSITPFLRNLHFLPVEYRIIFKIALLTFKCLNNMTPQYLKEMISLKTDSRKCLRIDNDFYQLQQPPEPRCSHSRGAFSYSAPRVWNQLPYALRSMTTVEGFKSALKTHLFRRAFRNDGGDYEFNIDMLMLEC